MPCSFESRAFLLPARAFLWRLDMGSKYMLAEGTTLQMSKEEVKDTSGNIATGATPVTYVDLADTTKTIDYSGESTDEVDVTTLASEGFKETALGLTDPGEFSFTGHYV
jgi:hypothetical protein